MRDWELAGEPAAESYKNVEKAFALFNETTDANAYSKDSDALSKRMRQGVHPGEGAAFATVGEYMAATLCSGKPERTERYHRYGGLVFFADYIKHYRDNGATRKSLVFDSEFEETVLRMSAEWERVWTPEARKFALGDEPSADSIEQELRALYSGSSLLPDYTGQIRGLAQQAFLEGDAQNGARLAMLGAELYPRSEQMIGLLGVVNIAMGQFEPGRELVLRAASWNSKGFADEGNLLRICGFFADSGNAPAARVLLEVTQEIHPDSPRVQEALASLTEID
jgi:hypothetical protein